jgi:TonB family protein
VSSDLENRIVYRSTPGAVKFAWRIVVLSVLMSAFIFILIPLTSKLGKIPEDLIIVRKVPAIVKVEDPDEIFEEEQPPPEKKLELEKVQPIVVPPMPPPPALSVNLEISQQVSAVKLHMDNNFKQDLNFDVEKIVAIAAKSPIKSTVITKTAPVKVQRLHLDYNSIFDENQVDKKAKRVRYVRPVYPMRARRRNLSGKVTLEYEVTKEGVVLNPRIIKAYPKGYFEKTSLEALSKHSFKPAMKDGRAVIQRGTITFDFGLKK